MDAIASSFTVSVLDCELAAALVLPTFGVGAGVLYPRWDEERNLLIKLFWEIYFFVPTSPPPCARNLTILLFDFQVCLCFINPLFVASAVGGLKDSNVCAKAPTNSTSHSLKPHQNHISQFHYSQLTTW